MDVPAVAVPVSHRSHIAVLEYLCDQQARKHPSLGHVFAALRSDISRLAEVIGAAHTWTTPTFEVVDYLPVPYEIIPAPVLKSTHSKIPIRRDVLLRNNLFFAQDWKRSLLIVCELERREREEVHYVRPVKFKVVRCKHSAMGRLMKLYTYVTEKMRGEEEADHYATIEELSHKQALRYLRACQRWLVERKIAGNQARTLKDILSQSRKFPN
jgi:hypothetical protein